MRYNTLSIHAFLVVPALLLNGIVLAEDRFWTGGDGGAFEKPDNWGGHDGVVPGLADTAHFDLTAAYFVDFASDPINQRLIVHHGQVTFNLAAHTYALTNSGVLTPSITIAESSGDLATLNVSGGTLTGQFIALGHEEPSIGFLDASGVEATIVAAQHLFIGEQGSGFLTLADGAQLTSTIAAIASAAGSIGSAELFGPATSWTCNGQLSVGLKGLGELIVRDGAQVICNDAIVAQQQGSLAEVLVSGPGSSWLINGTLDVGMVGFGTLTIADGATVSNSQFATIGTFPGAHDDDDGQHGYEGGHGTVHIVGPGSTWNVDGDVYVAFISSFGTLLLEGGGRALISGALEMNDELLIDGVHIRLASADDYHDQPAVDVGESIVHHGHPVKVQLVGGFVPAPTDEFWLISQLVSGPLPKLVLPKLPPPLLWHVIDDGFDLVLRVGPIEGDFNSDGLIGPVDLAQVLAQWGPCPTKGECSADLNDDDDVGPADLAQLLANWG